jgi:hypothetical protein
MLGEYVEVERASVHPENLKPNPDTLELPVATYEKLRRLAAEYLRSVQVIPCSRQPCCTKLFCVCSNVRIILGAAKRTSWPLQRGRCAEF